MGSTASKFGPCGDNRYFTQILRRSPEICKRSLSRLYYADMYTYIIPDSTGRVDRLLAFGMLPPTVSWPNQKLSHGRYQKWWCECSAITRTRSRTFVGETKSSTKCAVHPLHSLNRGSGITHLSSFETIKMKIGKSFLL
jgi:hypothetical protein